MEYTGNIMQDDTHLTSSLLKMFSMFEIRLSCGDDDLYKVGLKCIHCKKETGLSAENGFEEFYDEVITQFHVECNVAPCWYIMDNQLKKENGLR